MGAVVQETATGVPAPALRRFVRCYAGYRHTGLAPGVHAGLPGRSITFILAFDEPLTLTWHDGARPRSDRLWTIAGGLHEAAVAVHHSGLQHGIQLDVSPLGCRVLFGLPAAALARDVVDATDLLGPPGRDLLDRLAAAAGWPARFAVLDEALLRIVRQRTGGPLARPEIRRAWQLLERSDGGLAVADLADDLGWSRRHLLTQFRAEFGLGPKVMAQVMRFDRANRRLRGVASAVPLAVVAAECGYADQAHLTREFVRFAGAPPTIWREDPMLFRSVQDRDAAVG